MPGLRALSGEEVIGILRKFGFGLASQRGSHVKLRRVLPDGTRQTLTIPLHAELDRGTQPAAYRQASRFIPESGLRRHFYAE